MKIRIAVLDANNQQRNETLNKIDDYMHRRHIELVFDPYSSGTELLEQSIRGNHYDIYILETKVPELNAFYIARELRKQYRHCKIIYYSENGNAAVSAFEVGADNYVLKPASREKFDSCLDAAIAGAESVREYKLIEIKSSIGYMRISTEDIAYVNLSKRALCYHLTDGTTIKTSSIREPFRNAVGLLTENPDFCLLGASLLINLSAVETISNRNIFFCHGEWLTPPRTSFKPLYRKFMSRN